MLLVSCENITYEQQNRFLTKLCVAASDDFNRVRTVRPHRVPLKYIKNWPPTQEISLFLDSSTRTLVDGMSKRKEKIKNTDFQGC